MFSGMTHSLFTGTVKGLGLGNNTLSFFADNVDSVAVRESLHSLAVSNKSNVYIDRGLAIACLNINSLTSHIDERRVYTGTSKTDILTINETKLDSSINNNEADIADYMILLDLIVNRMVEEAVE
jgi:hypothetical protein